MPSLEMQVGDAPPSRYGRGARFFVQVVNHHIELVSGPFSYWAPLAKCCEKPVTRENWAPLTASRHPRGRVRGRPRVGTLAPPNNTDQFRYIYHLGVETPFIYVANSANIPRLTPRGRVTLLTPGAGTGTGDGENHRFVVWIC